MNINPPDESRTATGRNHPAASRGGRGEPHRMEDITMKTIEKRVKAIGSLTGMDQAVRLITNLGGVVIGVQNLEIDFLDGDECRTIHFKELGNGYIIMG